MEKMPAIVAIGYNRKDSMERLLNSILAADYPDGEIPLIISIQLPFGIKEVAGMTGAKEAAVY